MFLNAERRAWSKRESTLKKGNWWYELHYHTFPNGYIIILHRFGHQLAVAPITLLGHSSSPPLRSHNRSHNNPKLQLRLIPILLPLVLFPQHPRHSLALPFPSLLHLPASSRHPVTSRRDHRGYQRGLHPYLPKSKSSKNRRCWRSTPGFGTD